MTVTYFQTVTEITRCVSWLSELGYHLGRYPHSLPEGMDSNLTAVMALNRPDLFL